MNELTVDLARIAEELPPDDRPTFLDDVALLMFEVGGLRALAIASWKEANRRLLAAPDSAVSRAWLRFHCCTAAGLVDWPDVIPDEFDKDVGGAA